RIVVARVVLELVRLVDAERNIRRLLVNRDDDAAGVGVEPPFRVDVADLRNPLADELWDVHPRLGRDLPGNDDEPGRDQRLARDAPVGIVSEHSVEHRVRDLVGDLVRVALGDRLGREEILALCHEGPEGYLISRKARNVEREPSCLPKATSERNGSMLRPTSGGTRFSSPGRPKYPTTTIT